MNRRGLTNLPRLMGWTLLLAGLCLCNVLAMRDVDISPTLAVPGRQALTPIGTKTRIIAEGEVIVEDDATALAKPVFSPNRLPYLPPPPAPPPAPPPIMPQLALAPPVLAPPPQIRLQGIRNFGGVTSALVGVGDKTPEWVGVGDTIAGWQIDVIDRDHLGLASNDRRFDYYLYGEPPK